MTGLAAVLVALAGFSALGAGAAFSALAGLAAALVALAGFAAAFSTFSALGLFLLPGLRPGA
ncbi:MAG: hypothetical protein U0165_06820 [Polyangiaceae bacterium]